MPNDALVVGDDQAITHAAQGLQDRGILGRGGQAIGWLDANQEDGVRFLPQAGDGRARANLAIGKGELGLAGAARAADLLQQHGGGAGRRGRNELIEDGLLERGDILAKEEARSAVAFHDHMVACAHDQDRVADEIEEGAVLVLQAAQPTVVALHELLGLHEAALQGG